MGKIILIIGVYVARMWSIIRIIGVIASATDSTFLQLYVLFVMRIRKIILFIGVDVARMWTIITL